LKIATDDISARLIALNKKSHQPKTALTHCDDVGIG
jgi:hypothetical protein